MSHDVLSRQLVRAGQALDGVTGGRLRAPLRLEIRALSPGRAQMLAVSITPEGLFRLHADPQSALAPAATTLRLGFAADGYAPFEETQAFTAAQLARQPVALPGGAVAERIAGLPRIGDVRLMPLAVALRGTVHRADDPDAPVPVARIRVSLPAPGLPEIAVGPGGAFAFAALPVVAEITLAATAPGFRPATFRHRLDFTQAINRTSLTLAPV